MPKGSSARDAFIKSGLSETDVFPIVLKHRLRDNQRDTEEKFVFRSVADIYTMRVEYEPETGIVMQHGGSLPSYCKIDNPGPKAVKVQRVRGAILTRYFHFVYGKNK